MSTRDEQIQEKTQRYAAAQLGELILALQALRAELEIVKAERDQALAAASGAGGGQTGAQGAEQLTGS